MLWLDEDDPREWQQDGNRWWCLRGDVKLVVEKVGWLFPRWEWRIVLREGSVDSFDEAQQSAEKAAEKAATKRNTVLRLVRE